MGPTGNPPPDAEARRRVLIIGIGAGHPDHITLQAVEAMNRVDVFFIPDKGLEKEALTRLRLEAIDRHVRGGSHRRAGYRVPERGRDGGYEASVAAWHDAIEASLGALILEELDAGETGAFLVWGDPTLYDSTMRIIGRLAARPEMALDHDVIPGIGSVQALAAAQKATLNAIGRPVMITGGRSLADGFPDNADSLVVLLDVERGLRDLAGDLDVYWGANLGLEGEALVAGKLADVAGDIERLRAETRATRGWVMENALVRKPG